MTPEPQVPFSESLTENRLSTVTAGTATSSFLYGPEGYRIEERTPSGRYRYFGNLARSVDGALAKHYYAGPMLVAQRDLEGVLWHHADHLGSVRALSDRTGDKVKAYDFTLFGEGAAVSGLAGNDREFAGHVGDPESGLVYMVARYYVPELGRFLSPDSIVPEPNGPRALHRYAYVYNNPVSHTRQPQIQRESTPSRSSSENGFER